MFRLLPATRAMVGLAVSLLATAGAGSAGPAAPGQPRPAVSRPPVTVLRAHGSSAGGQVQTAFSCHQTGARGPARRSATHTLTVTGSNLAGQPDTGGTAWAFNTGNCASVRGATLFSHGRATFRVPAGHYLVMGEFITGPPAHRAVRLDVLPQVTVAGDTTARTAARAAGSRLTLATQRPATLQDATFTLIRTGQAGRARSRLAFSAFAYDGMSLWVSPVSQRPTAGSLTAYTTATLTSPPGQRLPYTYNLAFAGPRGQIPAQRRTVTDAHLAAVTERYYQDRRTSGLYAVAGGLRGQAEQAGTFAEWLPMHLPGRQIEYFTPGPAAVWELLYLGGGPSGTPPGGQIDAFRAFPPGPHTENWNAYPLHPSPAVDLTGSADLQELMPEASRLASTLMVDVSPFGDSVPGHTGWGFAGRPGQVTGSYQIDQNGQRIAGGAIPAGGGPGFSATARLSPHPSVVRLTVTAAHPGTAFPLSPSSRDVWTWRSAPRPGASVRSPWYCGTTPDGSYLRHCAVQPLLTLGYRVGRLALDGTAPPGRQVLTIRAGHLQLAAQPGISRIAVAMSVNGGRTWQAAATTRTSAKTFRSVFTAPRGAAVSLRVTARDAAGGSLAETIDDAYRAG